jgi:methyl-accepting chemotaxis protein
MSLLNNLKTSVKLIGGFVTISIITLVIAYMGYTNMKDINDGMTSMYFDRLIPIKQLGVMNTSESDLMIQVSQIQSFPDQVSVYEPKINEIIATMNKNVNAYRATFLVQEEKDNLAIFDKNWPVLQQETAKFLAAEKAGKVEDAQKMIAAGSTFDVAYKAVETAIYKLLDVNVTAADEINKQADITFANSVRLLLIISIAAFLFSIAIGVVISNSLSQPLGQLARIAVAVSEGDLVRDLDQKVKDGISMRKDEIGAIGKAFDALISYMQNMGAAAVTIANNDLTTTVTPKSPKDELGNAFARMVSGLQDTIGQVADSANNLGSASEQLATAASQAGLATTQISKTVQQVAQGTNQQSEATSRTAKAMEQMSRAIEGVARGAQEQSNAAASTASLTNQISEMVRQVAGNADAVTRESANAAKAAREGSNTVSSTIDGMRNIQAKVGLSARKVEEMGQRSDQIGTIVETIDDIASQTNLLALNAAIEAARAGEHGKGFAVVADEVRKLAERSSSATKEINGLIRGIQKTVAEAVQAMNEGASEVENGVSMANEAGRSLNNILSAAEAVFAQAEQAAKGTQRMSVLADQMVASADTVSSIIEENTASTEEMSANSAEVVQAIENIAAVSEENSAAAEEVSASTEEMSAQVEEVTASAEELSGTAQELRDLVSQFKLPQSAARADARAFDKKKLAPNSNGGSKLVHKPATPALASTKRYN